MPKVPIAAQHQHPWVQRSRRSSDMKPTGAERGGHEVIIMNTISHNIKNVLPEWSPGTYFY